MASEIKFKIKKTAELIPYVNNSRTHSDEQVAQIAGSIKEFGFVNPVLLGDDNVVIAGHGRLLAAHKLRLKEIPCMIIAGLSEVQRKALVLADNRLALSAGWDDEMLALELQALANENYDLSLTGFDEKELVKFLAAAGSEGLCDPDEVGEVPVDPVTRPGDIWRLGKHRLRCGDSTNPDHVNALLEKQEVELLFTSPPYSDIRTYSLKSDLSPEKLSDFIDCAFHYCQYAVVNLGLKRENHQIVSYWDIYIKKAKDCGYLFLSWGVWARPSAGSVGNQSAFLPVMHEWMFIFGKKFKDINRTEKRVNPLKKERKTRLNREKDGSMKRTSVGEQRELKELGSVINLPQEMSQKERMHPAQFPVALPEKYIEAITNPSDVIYEPFSGSGSTMIAAEKTGRVCYAMELSEAYCDMAVERWERFTGQSATLNDTGTSFKSARAVKDKGNDNRESGNASKPA